MDVQPLTVVLADADERQRSTTARDLVRGGFTVVAMTARADGAVAAALAHRPDLCLVEMDLPGGGVRAISEIAIAVPTTTVVAYTDSVADDHLFGALRAGARGYLLKGVEPARLWAALRGVVAGEASVPRHLMRRVLDDYSFHPAPDQAMSDRLTAREWDVLELMRQGLTTREIAARLYVAPVTVRSHIAAARRKLDAADRPAALRRLGAR
jgi:DNA-binding NarL/FixJ family response regulator